ncbi:3-methyladenine DNA glycosylase [Microbacterium sp. EYE_5]|nr:3-methyladenine DNA glycosylase [Microbacterium sp. EYE_382]MCK6085861.1 3-methyladenine DNA glycosylase [Microbacterium sp. EYE_384]MCK6124641.1 3-methyladenine DNA glycosylase [Microbacterium sp. EYE_80]MCK6127550.1 3-methyladenine DNA glycosylase [Microbacterium sp. EYE_79]MCK6141545.1 3-methyladenine DNA glycosylase [Microbacterium sp. EYE_39]MCK6219196.1 3-methyladenine DNA glycosylase [Microbacterium sp. EYE_5]MCK6228046.1 3-methyladenine DNA glycosylase [Microbacterium sp. EYE_77]M
MGTRHSPILERSDWAERMRAHAGRADALTAGRRRRAERGETHPVDDFLYTYYSYKPSLLRRWHPGRGTALGDAADAPHAGWRWYRSDGAVVVADAEGFLSDKQPLVRAIRGILSSTLARTGSFGCFGMHEWAMVYRDRATRHPVPLRLGPDATDAVVESHDLRCTHIDAFRFFTDEAVPRNRFAPTRETQAATEQPGCLHTGMDLYKWAVKLGPLVPGELLLDAFELARDIRELDMRASPYDLRDWGYAPVAVETPAGKSAYVSAQRGFTDRAQPIRTSLLALID